VTARARESIRRRTSCRRPAVALGAFVALALSACGDRYPLPALANTEAPTIRVRLGAPRDRAALRISSQGWDLTSTEGRVFAARDVRDVTTSLAAGREGIVCFGRETGATGLRLRTARSFVLDDVVYPGTLNVHLERGKLVFVNEVDLERYVAGVIANELAPGATAATYRAQAVTARTYGWQRLAEPVVASGQYHVFDGQSSQVYRGLTIPPVLLGEVTADDMQRRVAETRGVILTWEGRPFTTYYASTCGGHTTEALTSLLDPGHASVPLGGVPCGFCQTSRFFRWSEQIGEPDLVAGFLRDKRPIASPIHAIEVSERGRGGWAKFLQVTHGPRREVKRVPGSAFRSIARLHSHNILQVRRVPGGWRFDGAGWGHGVGMCQWGAIEMGRQGFSEIDILRKYYPGVAFTRVY
jgi:stage II sporulation protein D